MKNVLVIQLLGRDVVLQSTPALAALRKARQDAPGRARPRIHVLARRPFGDALHGNPDADEVIEWDMDALTPPTGGPDSLDAARRLSELRESLRPLREIRFDAIYNLSNDTMGALIAGLLKPRESAGLVLCRDRNCRVRNDMSAAAAGEWLRCLCVNGQVEPPSGSAAAPLSLFNLADIFTRACGSAEAPSTPRVAVSPADERRAEEVLEHWGPAAASGLIAIQPGVFGDRTAREGDARWPAPHWVALAAGLRRAGHGLLFLGGVSERAEMDAMARAVSPAAGGVLRRAEPASLGQFAALLRRCRLLVTADAAAAQTAAAAGTPCLFLALGSSNAWESGPSGEGHFVLEPKARPRSFAHGQTGGDLPGRGLPSPEAARAAVECALSDGADVPELPLSAHAVLDRSCRMPDGLLGLIPLGRPALTWNDLVRLMLRACLLCRRLGSRTAAGGVGANNGTWRPWLDEIFAWYSLGDRERLLRRAAQAAEGFVLLRRIARLGGQASQSWIEQRVLALGEDETLRPLVALFGRSLLDAELLSGRRKAVACRWSCHLLAEECGFMAQSLREFARCAGPARLVGSPRPRQVSRIRVPVAD